MENQITRLQAHLKEVPQLFALMGDDTASYKPAPERWSKKEILGHLIDSATNNIRRFIETRFKPSPYLIQRYDQDQCVAVNQYQSLPVAELLSLWTALNRHVITIMERQDAQSLDLPVQIDDSLFTLEWLLTDYVDHLEHHVRQIRKDLAIETLTLPYQISLTEAEKQLGEIAPKEFVTLLTRGTLEVELYKPDGIDMQTLHEKDELYVVISGTGTFVREDEQYAFQPHDVLFVPAGQEHRFIDFSTDFKTWVIFYGPRGGE